MNDRYEAGRCIVQLDRRDITQLDTDAIVNAANGSLLGGGGVDGAIHAAAGPKLLESCREVKRRLPDGVLRTGKAVLTPGFQLRAKYVIHCVGPIYARTGEEAPTLLASCYQNALALCRQHALQSVTFPSISTGVYGYPLLEAARVALATVKRELESHGGPELVRFALFDDRTLAAYAFVAREVFATPPDGTH